MKFSILHLSDIHFDDREDWIFTKAMDIAKSATKECFSNFPEMILVVVSGDIANKGKPDQYLVANEFLSNLRNHILQELDVPVHFIIVPGNHDCNLNNQGKLRNLAIESALQNNFDDEIFDKCLEVQDDFFQFLNQLEPKLNYPVKPSIYWKLEIQHNNHSILFNCFNTAWLTQLNETQGKLLIPKYVMDKAEDIPDNVSLAITVYHHPENWLEANNSIPFRSLLNRISDLIITGHEHNREVFLYKSLSNESIVQIHRAPVLQEKSSINSGFNLIHIDLKNKTQQITSFNWKRNFYSVSDKSLILSFDRNNALLKCKFKLNNEFEAQVKNINSLPLTHSRKKVLEIEDIFVMPRLQLNSLENIIDGKTASKLIERKNVLKFLFDERKVVLYGETLQGKTTLANYLFIKGRESLFVPIFIRGDLLVSSDMTEIEKVLRIEYVNQYDATSFDDFLTIDKSKRMIVIDNFGESRLVQAELQKVLSQLSARFGVVFAIAHTNLEIQQYIKNEENQVFFSDYSHCEIRPMNRTQRSDLIKKWIQLGNPTISEDKLVKSINQKQQIIESAVDTFLVPSYASYLLGILQVSDSATASTDKTKYGTIGYLYQSLITNRFERIYEEIDLSQIYLLISQMAYQCYKEDTLEISKDAIEEIINEYFRQYRENIHIDTFISQIVNAGIVLNLSQNYKFANYQMRDFFVAEYFSIVLGTGTPEQLTNAHKEIDHIIRTLIYESHARILLFLVFKAYDKPRFISQVLSISKLIYAKYIPAKFENEVNFLNELKQNFSRPKLMDKGNVIERREKADIELDEIHDTTDIVKFDDSKYVVEYRDDLEEFIKASIALKMLEVLGQLLRSFSSTLKAEIKLKIIQEGMDLGLRLLQSMYQLREDEVDEIREVLIKLIHEKHSELGIIELNNRAENLLLFAFQYLTAGVLKKISSAVGHDSLKNIYSEIFQDTTLPLSYKMVETTLKLDHYDDPQVDKILQMSKDLKINNRFIWEVLSILVANKLNFNSGLSTQKRNKLAAEFELGTIQPYLLNEEKGEQKYLPSRRNRYVPPPLKQKRDF